MNFFISEMNKWTILNWRCCKIIFILFKEKKYKVFISYNHKLAFMYMKNLENLQQKNKLVFLFCVFIQFSKLLFYFVFIQIGKSSICFLYANTKKLTTQFEFKFCFLFRSFQVGDPSEHAFYFIKFIFHFSLPSHGPPFKMWCLSNWKIVSMI